MKLTPLDIRKQEFARTFRGFDVDEVQAFLQMLSGQWEEMLSEQRRLDQRVRELESKLRHYERIEEALQEALETARESSKQALDSAREKSNRIIEEAESRSEEIKRAAERQRHEIRNQTNELIDRRNGIVARLRALLTSELELLAHFERSEAIQTGEADPVRVEVSRSGQLEPPAGVSHDEPAPEESSAVEEASPAPATVGDEDEVGDRGEGSGWVVRPVLTTAPQDESEEPVVILPDSEKGEQSDSEKTAATTEDIDRIRRILRDLD